MTILAMRETMKKIITVLFFTLCSNIGAASGENAATELLTLISDEQSTDTNTVFLIQTGAEGAYSVNLIFYASAGCSFLDTTRLVTASQNLRANAMYKLTGDGLANYAPASDLTFTSIGSVRLMDVNSIVTQSICVNVSCDIQSSPRTCVVGSNGDTSHRYLLTPGLSPSMTKK